MSSKLHVGFSMSESAFCRVLVFEAYSYLMYRWHLVAALITSTIAWECSKVLKTIVKSIAIFICNQPTMKFNKEMVVFTLA